MDILGGGHRSTHYNGNNLEEKDNTDVEEGRTPGGDSLEKLEE